MKLRMSNMLYFFNIGSPVTNFLAVQSHVLFIKPHHIHGTLKHSFLSPSVNIKCGAGYLEGVCIVRQ